MHTGTSTLLDLRWGNHKHTSATANGAVVMYVFPNIQLIWNMQKAKPLHVHTLTYTQEQCSLIWLSHTWQCCVSHMGYVTSKFWIAFVLFLIDSKTLTPKRESSHAGRRTQINLQKTWNEKIAWQRAQIRALCILCTWEKAQVNTTAGSLTVDLYPLYCDKHKNLHILSQVLRVPHTSALRL